MKTLLMTLTAVVGSFLWLPGAESRADTTATQKRVHCMDYNPLDPYVEVRGFLDIDGTNARGTLRVSLGAASPGATVDFRGQLVDDGRFNFAELYPENPGGPIDELYLDFKDDSSMGTSWLATAYGDFRLVCDRTY